jgi:1,4-alpha-glucan branching enzyme
VLGFAACIALFNPWSTGDGVLVPSPSKVLVQFRLDAPAAHTVTLAGDFTKWQPKYELTRSAPGVWTIVVPLDPGVHDYAFVVDGNLWTPDPMAPAIADGFGGLNSRVAVLSPDLSSL